MVRDTVLILKDVSMLDIVAPPGPLDVPGPK